MYAEQHLTAGTMQVGCMLLLQTAASSIMLGIVSFDTLLQRDNLASLKCEGCHFMLSTSTRCQLAPIFEC